MRTVHQILATGARRLRLRAIRKQLRARYGWPPRANRVLFLNDFTGGEMKLATLRAHNQGQQL